MWIWLEEKKILVLVTLVIKIPAFKIIDSFYKLNNNRMYNKMTCWLE